MTIFLFILASVLFLMAWCERRDPMRCGSCLMLGLCCLVAFLACLGTEPVEDAYP